MEQIQERNRTPILFYVFNVSSIFIFVLFLILSLQEIIISSRYFILGYGGRSYHIIDLSFFALGFIGMILSLVFSVQSTVLLSDYRKTLDTQIIQIAKKKMVYAWLIFIISFLLFLIGNAGIGNRGTSVLM